MHTHARVLVYDHAHVCMQNTEQESCWRHLQWCQLLTAYYTQGCVLLTSLTTSEGKDEGFRSPRNALVLPNELETKVRPGGAPW